MATTIAWLLLAGCEGLTPPEPLEHELIVSLSGSGIGHVVSFPVGINTKYGRYSASFADGSGVRLTARPEAGTGSTFAGFRFPDDRTLACESPSTPDVCNVTLSRPVVVEAVFEIISDPEELTVVLAGTGSGRVTSHPAGIDTTAGALTAVFERSSVVRLDASPAMGSTFAGFAFPDDPQLECEASSADGSCDITLDRAVTVEVVFEIITDPEELTVVLAGPGSGRVTSHPAGIDSSTGALTAVFERSSVVRLDASPAMGSTVAGFEFLSDPNLECGAGSDASTCFVVLDDATTVSVSFALSDDLVIGDQFDLVSSVEVAAGQIEFVLPANADLVFAGPARDDTVVHWSVTGGVARIVWLATSGSDGPQLRVAFDDEIAANSVEVRVVQAFDRVDGGPAGAAELSWREPDGPAHPPGSLPGLSELAATAELTASLADHPLGDLKPDGVLDVRDAMRLLELLRSGVATDFERYHGDVDGDGVIDAVDLLLLLERLVDPSLPASLQVKATPLSFVRLDPYSGVEALILLANRGREAFSGMDLSWSVPGGVRVEQVGGVAGQSLALRLTLPESARRGWLPGFARVTGPGADATFRVGHLVLLVAGQSNASGRGAPVDGWLHVDDGSVRMFGNDYLWRNASEPLDDTTNQVDEVSEEENAVRYSFGTRLGELLVEGTGFDTYLIPAAKGGVSVIEWSPAASLDRRTLYGSAHFRSLVSAALRSNPVGSQPFPSEAGPVSAVVWYQGESDASTKSLRDNFVRRTNEVMNAFATDLGAPTIYVQLASQHDEHNNLKAHAVAELQRRMETGSGHAEARPGFHMVVAFDLPRSDSIHLSAFGQRLLAERIDRAFRQHVLGEEIDGTGPRLRSITHSGRRIWLHTDDALAAEQLDPKLFTVFDGPPGDISDLETYGMNSIAIASVERDPADSRAVLITLSSAPSNVPLVRYMAEPNLLPDSGNRNTGSPEVWKIVASGTVRSSGSGLPLPAFGPSAPF